MAERRTIVASPGVVRDEKHVPGAGAVGDGTEARREHERMLARFGTDRLHELGGWRVGEWEQRERVG